MSFPTYFRLWLICLWKQKRKTWLRDVNNTFIIWPGGRTILPTNSSLLFFGVLVTRLPNRLRLRIELVCSMFGQEFIKTIFKSSNKISQILPSPKVSRNFMWLWFGMHSWWFSLLAWLIYPTTASCCTHLPVLR